jgi:hypothetical protein
MDILIEITNIKSRFKKFIVCQLFELFKYGVEFPLIGSYD